MVERIRSLLMTGVYSALSFGVRYGHTFLEPMRCIRCREKRLGTVVIVLTDEPDVSAPYAALNSSVQDAGRTAQAGYLIHCATRGASPASRVRFEDSLLGLIPCGA